MLSQIKYEPIQSILQDFHKHFLSSWLDVSKKWVLLLHSTEKLEWLITVSTTVSVQIFDQSSVDA